jgi:UDP-glucose 4-epimerase
MSSINLINAMRKHNVHRLLFSSTATVYGEPETFPITEKFPLDPKSPYAKTKMMIEHFLIDEHKSAPQTWRFGILRYFNPVGAHPSGKIGEDPNGIPNNLMPFITKVAIGKLPELSIFGNDYPTRDGTGIRDYIHVVDLAQGHLSALEKLNGDPCAFTLAI